MKKIFTQLGAFVVIFSGFYASLISFSISHNEKYIEILKSQINECSVINEKNSHLCDTYKYTLNEYYKDFEDSITKYVKDLNDPCKSKNKLELPKSTLEKLGNMAISFMFCLSLIYFLTISIDPIANAAINTKEMFLKISGKDRNSKNERPNLRKNSRR